jgi:hypothetical protein
MTGGFNVEASPAKPSDCGESATTMTRHSQNRLNMSLNLHLLDAYKTCTLAMHIAHPARLAQQTPKLIFTPFSHHLRHLRVSHCASEIGEDPNMNITDRNVPYHG